MKAVIFFLGLGAIVAFFVWAGFESAPESEINEVRDLPLPAPQADVATRNALEAAWAHVKDNGFDVHKEGLSAEEFAKRDFPLQTMMLREGNAVGADVNVIYIGAEEVGEEGIPTEVFVHGKSLHRAWFDLRYQVKGVEVSADGTQILVESRPTFAGSAVYFFLMAVGGGVAAIGWFVALVVAVAIVKAVPGPVMNFWYRMRS